MHGDDEKPRAGPGGGPVYEPEDPSSSRGRKRPAAIPTGDTSPDQPNPRASSDLGVTADGEESAIAVDASAVEHVDEESSGSSSARRKRPDSAEGSEQQTFIEPSSSLSSPSSRLRRATANGRGKKSVRPDRHAGQLLAGRYRLERLLAKGGMGRVYLATQLPLDRKVAVKVLNPEFKETDPQFVRRFKLEASICARLTHPNTVTVFDYGEGEGGELFMAMEYLDGRVLSQVISEEAPFDVERTIHIAIQVCRGLREAHKIGVIHRDLKPGNVMLINAGDDPDYAKVLDFGLVKLFQPDGKPSGLGKLPDEHEPDLTRQGTLLGSPRYMSPEQIRGDVLDPRTDIYSLGVILYQMAAGRAPFTGATSVDVIYKHMNHPVPPISEGPRGVPCPVELESIIMRCLAKQREQRYTNMDALLLALKDARRTLTGVSSGGTSEMKVPAYVSEAPPGVTVSSPPAPVEVSSIAQSETASVSAARPDLSPRREVSKAAAPPSPEATAEEEPAREAAFRDPAIHDDSVPSGSLSRGARRPPSRMPLVVASMALGVALVLLVLALIVWPGPRPVEPPAAPVRAAAVPPAPPPPRMVKVTFDSTPRGASVRVGGASIGVTPFDHTFTAAPEPIAFEFQLDGHEPLTLRRALDGDATIAAQLKPVEPPPPAVVEPAPEPEPPRPAKAARPKPAKAKRPPAPANEENEAVDEPPPEAKPKRGYRSNPYN